MVEKKMISIIIPVYNGEHFIRRCLDSVLNQTYRNIEIVVVDDGSKDNSYMILKKYEEQDGRVRAFTKPNGGVSSTRNFGIEHATGEYLMFVDIDDYVDPMICEKLYAVIKQGYDYVVCGHRRIEGMTNMEILPAEGCENDGVFQHQFKLLLERAAIYTPWGKLYKKELITEKFNTSRSIGEDFEFNICYFKGCNNLAWLNEALYYYDATVEGSLSKKLEEFLNSDIHLCEITEDFMNEREIYYPDFNKKYYEKFRVHLQRAYEQKYTYKEFKKLFFRLLFEGGYWLISNTKTTEGFLNKITRVSIRFKIPSLTYAIIFTKKKLKK